MNTLQFTMNNHEDSPKNANSFEYTCIVYRVLQHSSFDEANLDLK